MPLWKKKGVEGIKLYFALIDNKKLDNCLRNGEATADHLTRKKLKRKKD